MNRIGSDGTNLYSMIFPNFFLLTLLILLLVASSNAHQRIRQLRPTRDFKDMKLSTAAQYGKRAMNMHVAYSILLEWLATENGRTRLHRRDGMTSNEDLSYK